MAYRADIEIAVKGAQELKRLQNKIRTAADAVNSLNSNLSGIANLLPRSFNNLNKVVGEAAANFNAVALGTKEASEAARDYYQANKTLNNALRERIKLLNDIQTAERGTVLANIKASQASRAASGFGAFSASIDIPTQKSIRRNQEKRAVVEAAAETANQIQKLADRQEEFTTRTNAGAQAAARQTAEFYRLARIAKEVAKINAAAGPAQLLLAPAAPGAPAMSGGARRRITGPVERLGGDRTVDEAAMALRFAQALQQQARPLSQIEFLYAGIAGEAAKLQRIKALPDTAMLNASARGIKQLQTAEDMLNTERQESVARLEQIDRLEASRARRARKLQERQQYMAGEPVQTATGPVAGGKGGRGSRLGGAISGSIIGGAFPLLFGQGAGAAAGGAIGGLLGGLAGPGGSFAGSLLGTLLGDIASKGNVVKKLGEDIGFSAQQTKTLETAFKQVGGEFDKFQASVQNIRGLSLAIEDQANVIRLVSTLTEKYGGEIDKTTNAYTSAIEAGKVTQATLNQLTNQGIPIQQALADKYKVSRSELLQMAKDGKISVQDLSDTLVDLGNKGVSTTEKTKTGFDNLVAATKNVGTALSRLGGIIVSSLQGPLDWLSNRLASIVDAAARGISRINDLLAGGKKAQASIQASAAAQTLTRNKFGVRAINPFDTEVQNFRTAQEKDIYRRLTGTKLGPDSSEARPPLQKITIPGQLPPSDGGGEGKAKKERESQLADILAANGLFRSQEAIAERIAVAEVDRNTAEVARLQHIDRSVQLLHEAAAIQRSSIPLDEKQAKLAHVQDKLAASANKYEREILTEKIAQQKAVNEIIADLELELKLKTATTEQERERLRLEAERVKLKGKGFTDEQIGIITGLQAQVAAPLTDAQKIEQHIGKLKDEVADLTNIGNIAITVADGIGTAFSQAFQGLISGSMTAKEALGSFFKSVADMFLEMAAQIIAKQMTMIILQTILKALGGGFGGGGGGLSSAFSSSGPTFNPGAFSMPSLAANGATFANGIAKFASGGIVSSPTLFKFADGGTTRTGLMGEAGPEAIMPLKRGSDGSLGVQANGLREAMNQDRAAGGGTPVLNMSFQSTNIGGVEYVSRDQLEAAMEQTRRDASRDGAKRGMTMTLDRIQNSSSTRRRIGV